MYENRWIIGFEGDFPWKEVKANTFWVERGVLFFGERRGFGVIAAFAGWKFVVLADGEK